MCGSLVTQALGPHELIVLVNGSSPDSVEIAEAYAGLRKVPAANVIRLKLPAAFSGDGRLITLADFGAHIWEPAWQQIKARGLERHTIAWVYSSGFPTGVRLKTETMSLTGLTFLRNQPISDERVATARYRSPLFNAPIARVEAAQRLVIDDAPLLASSSFDRPRQLLGKKMPLPAMMLGVTGRNGNSVNEIVRGLTLSAQADGRAPTGTVLLVRTKDVARSKPREWQFESAKRELTALGVGCEILGGWPRARVNVIGLMTGASTLRPRENDYRPGAIADHLTSFAAGFQNDGQTKTSAWIREGVAGTAGTVVEPKNYWSKFPHARVFVHYAAGCTLMESYAQAVGCPAQLLVLGDPLCAPWAPKARLQVSQARGGKGQFGFNVTIDAADPYAYSRLMVLVDDRLAGVYPNSGGRVTVTKQSAGVHHVRVVAYRSGLIRSQCFGETDVAVQ